MKMVHLSRIIEEGISHDPEIKKKVMLKSGDVPHLTKLSRAFFPPGTSARAHAHEHMHEIFIVESGSGIIQVNGKKYHFQKGMCVVVQPGEVHEIFNGGSEELVITYLGIEE